MENDLKNNIEPIEKNCDIKNIDISENISATEINLTEKNISDENNIIETNSSIQINIDDNTIENNNTIENDIFENNTSNCLALTIKEDYKLTSKTNRILRSLRMSFKVFVSYVTLNIIKLFF